MDIVEIRDKLIALANTIEEGAKGHKPDCGCPFCNKEDKTEESKDEDDKEVTEDEDVTEEVVDEDKDETVDEDIVDESDSPKEEVDESNDDALAANRSTELRDILLLAGLKNLAEEWANEPDEVYYDADQQLNGMAGGLNRPKKQRKSHGQYGDNAVTTNVVTESIRENLTKRLNESKKN